MTQTELLLRTEVFVRKLFTERKSDMMIAHDFNHINRVRNWALLIAGREGYKNLEIIEVTALLHDIGLAQTTSNERKEHGSIGARMAAEFLRENSNLSENEVELIIDAIKYHGLSPSIVDEHLVSLGDECKLLEILRDADIMDAFGAIGLIRAFVSRYNLPEYNPANIKGDAWGLSSSEFKQRFGADPKKVLAPVNTVIDQVNQQIIYYHNLHTQTAKDLARPLVGFMKNFILQLEQEISHTI
jgi:putative nucleotidyltransferase with HDIG domain